MADKPKDPGSPPGAFQKAESADSNAVKHVVLHDQVGHRFFKGDVVGADQLGDDAELRRLLDLEAVRPATDAEAKERKVTVADIGASHPTFEQKFADQRTEIGKLQNQLAEAQQKFNSMRAQELTRQAAVPNQPSADLIREKDSAFEQLRIQHEALKRQVQEAGGHAESQPAGDGASPQHGNQSPKGPAGRSGR